MSLPCREPIRILLVHDPDRPSLPSIGSVPDLDLDAAPDAATARGLFHRHPYQAILVAPDFLGGDAPSLIRYFKNETPAHAHQRPPVIALVRHSQDREDALAAGADDLLDASTSVDHLTAFLAPWVSRFPPTQPVALPPTTAAPPTPARFDPDELIDRMMGNPDLARRVARMFLDDTPLQLAALAQALDSRDPAEARRIAHSVRGAAGNVTADSVQDLASQIENLGHDLDTAAQLFPLLAATFDQLQPTLKEFCDS